MSVIIKADRQDSYVIKLLYLEWFGIYKLTHVSILHIIKHMQKQIDASVTDEIYGRYQLHTIG